MRFSKYILTFLFITGTIWANAQVADTSFTLQKCLDIAIKNNLQVKQSNANAELARVDYRQAIENLLPNMITTGARQWLYAKNMVR